jgi:hypothetical protein
MRWASGDGVSPRRARRRVAGRGGAGRGMVMRGKGCDGSTEGLRAFPAAFIGGRGVARRASVWHGSVGRGGVRHGKGYRRWHGGFGLPATLTRGGSAMEGLGPARQGRLWPDSAWPGMARAADSSTELLRGLPAALFGGQIGRGLAMQSVARWGEAWRGELWLGKG